jgi:hypothetical protein
MRRGTNGNDAHEQLAGCRKVVAKYTFERSEREARARPSRAATNSTRTTIGVGFSLSPV